MSKICLIDGHSILNRAYFGLPDLTTSNGIHTNAVYGFINIMTKIIEAEQPEYLTVAFDVHAKTFRHNLYEEYKGTRKKMDPELRSQVPLMKKMLQSMGIFMIEMEGFEADDLLGTVAGIAEKKGLEVTIVSGDRDLLQLATKHTKIMIPKTKKTGTEIEVYYEQDVIESYGVTPKEFIDVKALWGDTADNIPGVPGIGEKTSKELIASFHSIEEAYAHAAELKPPRAAANIVTYYEQAKLSKILATIDTNVPVNYQLEDAKLLDIYTDEAYDLCKELEFKNLFDKFQKTSSNQSIEKQFEIVDDFVRIEDFFHKCLLKKNSCQLGISVMQETDCYGMGFCDGKDCIYIPIGGFVTKEYFVSKLEQLLKAGVCFFSMQLKSILSYFGDVHSYREQFEDLTVMAYLLDPIANEYPTEHVAKSYLNLYIPSQIELFGKEKLSKVLQSVDDRIRNYACYEAYVAYYASAVLKSQLLEMNMLSLYETMEKPLIFVLYDMEEEGVYLDNVALITYGNELSIAIHRLEELIYEQAGEEFNINSPKQLGVILFEKLMLPGGKKTKTGYSTKADVLEKLAKDYPLVKDILEYRQLAKLKSTYADGLLTCIKQDGRLHTTFQQTITATGRLSSTEPNLQNIPIRMEQGKKIRKVFLPREGYLFVDADYSQIELRVLAHLSGDEHLIEAYRQNQDIHRATAALVFHKDFNEVTELDRRNAKAVNFGIVYGISSFGLGEDLHISRKEAQHYIDDYYEAYPKLKEYLDGLVLSAKESGYAYTLFHRRRPIPELSSSNFMVRSFGERIAMNSPIQGTAADIIKMAMIAVSHRIEKEHLSSRLILQVHDELLIETKQEEEEIIKAILKEEMEHTCELLVPLNVDICDGMNWYDAK